MTHRGPRPFKNSFLKPASTKRFFSRLPMDPVPPAPGGVGHANNKKLHIGGGGG